MKTFSTIEEFLELVPQDKALDVNRDIITAEFQLTYTLAINTFKKRFLCL